MHHQDGTAVQHRGAIGARFAIADMPAAPWRRKKAPARGRGLSIGP